MVSIIHVTGHDARVICTYFRFIYRISKGESMEVKIGDKIYRDSDEPIMVILTPLDKENITRMEHSATRYCSAPGNVSTKELEDFMLPK